LPGSVDELRVGLARRVTAVRDSIREKGLVTTAKLVAAIVFGQLFFPLTRLRRRDRRFIFLGERLPYTMHRYNNTYRNERAVEISIARWFLSGGENGRVLEVGNVLSHYGMTGHTVIDKYETAPGVINDDIVDHVPGQSFDLVVSISTLEHVGWDEQPREPEKVFRAFEAVRRCVAPGGRLLVSIPIGYNPTLDEGLRSGALTFDREIWLIRTTRDNAWRECARDEALASAYGHPFPAANALWIGMDAG
jgi:SAM-dependent methyltransferase